MQRFIRRFFQAKPKPIEKQSQASKIPSFQIIDNNGKLIDKTITFEKDELLLYKNILLKMIETEKIEDLAMKMKLMGDFSFYMTSFGETGTVLGVAAAINSNDEIFSQYSEYAALYYRGFTIQQLTDNLRGNSDCLVKGRQMPIHFSDKSKGFYSVSSPLATNISQAAGYGYGLAKKNENKIVVNFFGEGAASEGDFYAGINFAQTLSCQTLFVCRNNGYAISTPIIEQTSGDGILPKALAFDMEGHRVDGNDAIAVYRLTKRLRNFIIENQKPAFIEAMTYRISDHSSSDTSTKYRSKEEIQFHNNENNPIVRLTKFLKDQNVLDSNWEKEIEVILKRIEKDLETCMKKSKSTGNPHIDTLFEDVYDKIPASLQKQKQEFYEHLERNKLEYEKKAKKH